MFHVYARLPSPKLTFSPLKVDGGKIKFPFGGNWPIFRGQLLVSGRVTLLFGDMMHKN